MSGARHFPPPSPSGPPPLVSVIIVSYATRDLTVRCVTALQASKPTVPYEIVVVDNASGDGSAEAIAEACPTVRVIAAPTNLGFGRAVNLGARHAQGEFLLLLNPDTVPTGDLIGELATFAAGHPDHGVYAGRSLTPAGVDELSASFGPPTLWGYLCFATGLSTVFPRWSLVNPEKLLGAARRRVGEVRSVSGCVTLIDRTLFERLGGFAERYFMYSEDVDLSVRARAAGARPLYDPSATVIHIGGASSSSVSKRTLVLRGKCTFVREHWAPGRAAIGLALISVGVAVRAFGTVLLRRSLFKRPQGDQSWLAVWRHRAVWRPGWPEVRQPLAGVEVNASEPVPSEAR
jgi:N-acetylglucosaminyl-diphospho-decaprenol L-rhamnosyltransferase